MIDKITQGFAPINPVQTNVAPVGGQVKTEAPSSFGQTFENALKEVDDMQHEADKQIEGLVLKKEGVTPHGAMVALEKADIAFQLMSAVRSKIIAAYQEVIRTQV